MVDTELCDLDRMLALCDGARDAGTEFLFISPEKLALLIIRIRELEAELRGKALASS